MNSNACFGVHTRDSNNCFKQLYESEPALSRFFSTATSAHILRSELL
jgi:hypothetical protein